MEKMREIMWAENKVDCYDGPNCDRHRKVWKGYCAGDKEGGEIGQTITLNTDLFPPGTKVVVSVPICPKCHMGADFCTESGCDFDWHAWAEEQYS